MWRDRWGHCVWRQLTVNSVLAFPTFVSWPLLHSACHARTHRTVLAMLCFSFSSWIFFRRTRPAFQDQYFGGQLVWHCLSNVSGVKSSMEVSISASQVGTDITWLPSQNNVAHLLWKVSLSNSVTFCFVLFSEWDTEKIKWHVFLMTNFD